MFIFDSSGAITHTQSMRLIETTKRAARRGLNGPATTDVMPRPAAVHSKTHSF
jgi:hypothetical protein